MPKPIQRNIHRLDAANIAPGRLATKIVSLLCGKHKPDYEPRLDQGDIVEVKNIKLLKITGQKAVQKKYYHYSGYPGGLKQKQMKDLLAKKPESVLYRAVKQMLPKNTFQIKRLKRLKIS
ncbi:50S ribosomal protein L13 [Candidatus Falkowbacteria bacterium CG23_combo_of_CG06-09_8_20_14_all_49_15]|uniref:Large ribosomal subunit protein uL13 n=1 Tax=Candidatus Falkowbacteria bacterium CG23_combo_of_CG06-09_8_20_14_all_49_15 TaxID=1974572 RepID=A0A2G9ZMT4_9BACT|nr:MAG: 50S ribosomal protein L13 [Candidatus Falkowbacteria bacterium CG23_combo_of_CG06-09_8_20_14_all_49_15]